MTFRFVRKNRNENKVLKGVLVDSLGRGQVPSILGLMSSIGHISKRCYKWFLMVEIIENDMPKLT